MSGDVSAGDDRHVGIDERAGADAVLLAGFSGDTLPDWLAARLRNGLAGVCLFATNVTTPARLRALTDAIRAAHPAAIIAIDEEGGDVTRVHHHAGSPYPGNAVLGRLDDLDATRRVADTVGRQLRMAGVNLDLAPDVDVNSNPDNPVIGVRSFGDDPRSVARHGAAWTEALQDTGVAACAKHFPGHGDTAEDSHLDLPVVTRSLDQLREVELEPFRAAIDAGVAAVMTSHILLPRIDPSGPATFSSVILQGLLRRELGFDGVIVSDALDMAGASGAIGIPEAAVRALVAGCDLLCVGTDNDDDQFAAIGAAVDRALDDGRLSDARWMDARQRVDELAHVVRRMPLPEYEPTTEIGFDIRASASVIDGRPDTSLDLPVVVLESRPNSAVGDIPWGLEAAGATVTVLREGEGAPGGGPFLVVGKDIHRLEWTRAVVDELRARGAGTVVVEMGWPSADRAYADIATFGASRHMGAALMSVIARSSADPRSITIGADVAPTNPPEGGPWPRS